MNFSDVSNVVDNNIERLRGDNEHPIDGFVRDVGSYIAGPISQPLDLALDYTLPSHVSMNEAAEVLDNFNAIDAILDEGNPTVAELDEIIERLSLIEETGYYTISTTHNPSLRNGVYDGEHFTRDPELRELANAIAEERYKKTGVLGDGAYGDNILGDGYAYDYTQDIDRDPSDYTADGQLRPQTRPDDLGETSNGKPVILDLDNDGVEVTVDGSVSFDVDGDGFLERSNWAASDDGFLVIDLNADGSRGAGDGRVNQARELSFSLWGNQGDTDLQALQRSFDDNNDFILDDRDTVWSELRVWRDVNQNGISENGEVRTLAHWGITQINLRYDDGSAYSDRSDDVNVFGNTLHGLGSFTMNGEIVEGGLGDVSLMYNEAGWRRVDTASGYAIEFENGEMLHYAVMDGSGSSSVNLDIDVLDGASGDGRSNYLDAAGHSRSVQISGGGGNDTIRGGDNNDMLSGDSGFDNLKGHGGNDVLFVDWHDLNGGYVSGNDGIDTLIITGDRGVSVSLADHEVEVVYGSQGNDILSGSGMYNDLPIYGGEGNDTLRGGYGSDRLSGDGGDDVSYGGSGDDALFGGSGRDTLNGNNDDDMLFGGAQQDLLNGGNGDDDLLGGAGNDTLYGGSHDDVLTGGTGSDQLSGGLGDDTLRGDEGDDNLYLWRGDDLLFGGEGNDNFYLQTGTEYGDDHSWGWSIIHGGTGFDTLELTVNSVDDIRKIGGENTNQWQLVNFNAPDDKVIIDLLDVERIRFADGRVHTLSTDTNLDTSDDYRRDNYNRSMGDSYLTYDGGGWYKIGEGNIVSHGDGWSGNDTINGHDGNSNLDGGEGADAISGNDGNDTIRGRAGTDTISGGNGNDLIYGQTGADAISGGNDQDSIYGYEGSDRIWGGNGNDLVYGHSGSDVLSGDEGNDTLNGGDGYDSLFGGDGNDNLIGGTGSDMLIGGAGFDVIDGGYGADELAGGEGDDTLTGGRGFDALYGDAGSDSMDGGQDDDWLFGGDGADTLKGGTGSDLLQGGTGADSLDGGLGILDVASYQSSKDAVVIDLAQGLASGGDAQGDVLTSIESLVGSNFGDQLTGDDIDNFVEGLGGKDTIYGGGGHDMIDGGDDYDKIYAGDGEDRVWGGNGRDNIWLQAGDDAFYDNDQTGQHSHDTVRGGSGNDEIHGGGGNDLFVGDQGTDYLSGGDGDDRLYASGTGSNHHGHDTLEGGAGNDALYGANGRQNLSGGAGDDTLNGGNDVSTADQDVLYGGAGNDRLISGQTVDVHADHQANGDHLFGEDGNDTLEGGKADDYLIGGNGADSITGGDGDDIIFTGSADGKSSGGDRTDTARGGDGNDSVVGSNGRDNLYGDAGNDTLKGGDDWTTADTDYLYGGSGNDLLISGQSRAPKSGHEHKGDRLYGQSGNDTLQSGKADDILNGGSGADVFDFHEDFGNDVIEDFQVNKSGEKIDLHSVSSITSFSDLTANHLSQSGGDATINAGGGNTIRLEGVSISSLSADDFIF